MDQKPPIKVMKEEAPSSHLRTTASVPSPSILAIVRVIVLSVVTSQLTILFLWGGVTTLCHPPRGTIFNANGGDGSSGDGGGGGDGGRVPVCPHTFYAETADGQCVALLAASASSSSSASTVGSGEGGGRRSVVDSHHGSDFSSGVICQDAAIALALARKYSPFLPPADPIHSSCCDGPAGDLVDSDGWSNSEKQKQEKKKKKANPIARFFSRQRNKNHKKSGGAEERENDTIIIQRVVSRHRSSPDGRIDPQHPMKRIVETAAMLFGRRRAKEMEIEEERKKKMAAAGGGGGTATTTEDFAKSLEWAVDASSRAVLDLDDEKRRVVAKVLGRVRDQIAADGGSDNNNNGNNNNSTSSSHISSVEERLAAVGWGGPLSAGGRPWWLPSPSSSSSSQVDEQDGERLAAAYLKIMGWPTTEEYTTTFPFGKCAKADPVGCDLDFAFVHTLEWREKFRPWCMTPSAVKESEDGFFYVRGYSPPPVDSTHTDDVGHTLVFYRPGLHRYDDTEAYLRLLMHTLDAAVADSLSRSNNKIGKFNIILDCNGFGISMIPGLSHVKRLFAMMQDHFPDRLGVLMIVNLSGPGQLFLKMIKSVISEAVKRKIHIIPDNDNGRDMLEALVDEAYIPTWLGGTDDYAPDAKVVYADRLCSEEEGREYYLTMPYHAP
eukprot:CAMPEP_0178538918 /NCGR_PEP_ID=MMETSP0697-20121206/231_1 /TAXON_ID=265572 /ORGANISM="Extubocellulus spinifer, Strain CCMP396" /LENGTH=663 /DNA_ID=CAMNT_0020171183 /DNA_START=130 /DNA_END=2121 /DNA_ORIENTATION=-